MCLAGAYLTDAIRRDNINLLEQSVKAYSRAEACGITSAELYINYAAVLLYRGEPGQVMYNIIIIIIGAE